MHTTAMISGSSVGMIYGAPGSTVIDLGGLNVNGSLRETYEKLGMKYICVDIEAHPSVDVVTKPGEKLPFETGSIDFVVSTSCFEHDPCFWITFKEMCRIVKLGGFIYVNAPSKGPYHKHPGDNWRFYSDAGQALAYWSGYKSTENEVVWPARVEETFHILPIDGLNEPWWNDFICVWKRVEEKETNIIVEESISNKIGPLCRQLINRGLKITNKIQA